MPRQKEIPSPAAAQATAQPGSALASQTAQGGRMRCDQRGGQDCGRTQRDQNSNVAPPRKRSDAAEDQGRVGAAEAERVGDRDVDLHLPRRVGHVVEIALRVAWLRG